MKLENLNLKKWIFKCGRKKKKSSVQFGIGNAGWMEKKKKELKWLE